MGVFAQRNPTLDKVAGRLLLAGAERRAPILAGFHSDVALYLRDGERHRSVKIYSAGGFTRTLTATTSGLTATVSDLVFGTDTDTGAAAVLNTLEWVTNYGTVRRQLWVKSLPQVGALYISNQEAQQSTAVLYTQIAGAPTPYFNNASFSINIFPFFADEFTTQHWYVPNAYANTLRSWGGAATAQVFLDGVEAIAEQDIADIHGYYWEDPTHGAHTITVRLRTTYGSIHYVDLTGNLRVRQIPCS